MEMIKSGVIGMVAYTGSNMATAKITKVCDMKTAVIYSIANQITQVACLVLNPLAASTDIWLYSGAQALAGCLGGSIATKMFGSKELTLKDVAILTAGGVIQGAIYGSIIGIAIVAQEMASLTNDSI